MKKIAKGFVLAVFSCVLPPSLLIDLHASDQPADKRAGTVTYEPFVLKAVDGDIVGQMGHLTVLQNREKPDSGVIDIAFVHFKSTATNPGPPIFDIAGGPGGPGIPNPKIGGKQEEALKALLQVSDVIYWDQRGAGRSTLCKQVWDYPLESVRTREGFVNDARRLGKACADDYARQGLDLATFNSYASADDLMDLATTLKADKIMIIGGSYGTHLSLATIRRHPKRILRSVMMSVEGPDDTIKLPSNEQKELEKIAALVKTDPTMGPLVPDMVGMLKSVLDKLAVAPVSVTAMDPRSKQQVKVTISKFDVQMAVADALGPVQSIRKLPAAVYDMSMGDFSYAAASVLRMHGKAITSAMAAQMDCASGVSPQRMRRIKQEAGETLLGDVIDLPHPDFCDAWAPNDLGADFRGPLHTDVPAIFISGDIDGHTPPSNAESAAQGFTHHHLIVVGNAGHSPYLNAPKILDAVVEFFKNGTMPSFIQTALPPLVFDMPARASTPTKAKESELP